MFSKLRDATFVVAVLFISQTVLGRPLESANHVKRVHKVTVVRAQVVRAQVVPREASANCTSCATRTFTVSGTATASAAFTVTVGSPASTATPNAIGNFGSCSVPQIEFGTGFDGRKETSFRPVDQASYNHASADNISIITDFICSALVNTCNADATAQVTCATAQTAAATEIPQEGIDADAFNAVFGIQTNFKDVAAVNDNGDPIVGSTANATSTGSLAPTSASSTTSPTSVTSAPSNAGAPLPSPSTPASSKAATTESVAHNPTHTTLVTIVSVSAESADPEPTNTNNSHNLQTFTGALGNIPAPAVVAAGSQFQVEGSNSLFNKLSEALSRSCSDQKNDCANAANASRDKGSFTVDACGTQEDTCNAASGT
ncbi:hypothetical protein B0H19DRAFT_1326081 [Mycena capillaripes]|nr:hypothetical protein B0H19DRAFT_1326081 [Mycena capillaripes]